MGKEVTALRHIELMEYHAKETLRYCHAARQMLVGVSEPPSAPKGPDAIQMKDRRIKKLTKCL